ncbi:MAG: hypothetical protein ACM3P1_06805, partial [Candidatus Saccharibacteria bacterium]
MMSPHNFWKKYEFKAGQTYLFKAGFAQVMVKRTANGWLMKSKMNNQAFENLEAEEIEEMENDPEALHFQTGKSHHLILAPAFPAKAVVFRNNKTIKISAAESAHLYFRIPLTLQFYFDEVKEENRMFEMPLQRLSDTWFGEADSGEPAFSIGNNYDIALSEVKALSWEAIVPVEIINNTTAMLELQRLILRVEEFSLYLKNKQIYSNNVEIEFRGPEHAGNITLSVKNDIHGSKPVLFAKPRISGGRNLLRKSFYFIKNIYQS